MHCIPGTKQLIPLMLYLRDNSLLPAFFPEFPGTPWLFSIPSAKAFHTQCLRERRAQRNSENKGVNSGFLSLKHRGLEESQGWMDDLATPWASSSCLRPAFSPLNWPHWKDDLTGKGSQTAGALGERPVLRCPCRCPPSWLLPWDTGAWPPLALLLLPEATDRRPSLRLSAYLSVRPRGLSTDCRGHLRVEWEACGTDLYLDWWQRTRGDWRLRKCLHDQMINAP